MTAARNWSWHVMRLLWELGQYFSTGCQRVCQAIIFGVQQFHQYLYGRSFMIYSDHKPHMNLFDENWAIPVTASARVQEVDPDRKWLPPPNFRGLKFSWNWDESLSTESLWLCLLDKQWMMKIVVWKKLRRLNHECFRPQKFGAMLYSIQPTRECWQTQQTSHTWGSTRSTETRWDSAIDDASLVTVAQIRAGTGKDPVFVNAPKFVIQGQRKPGRAQSSHTGRAKCGGRMYPLGSESCSAATTPNSGYRRDSRRIPWNRLHEEFCMQLCVVAGNGLWSGEQG